MANDLITSPPALVVFDVESVGLHGPCFAFGAVALARTGAGTYEPREEAYGAYVPDLRNLPGGAETADALWVAAHVLPNLSPNEPSPYLVRWRFWRFWTAWRNRGALLVADVPWPVEARFLEDCIADAPRARVLEAPYPLLDLASMFWIRGVDPTGVFSRLDDELPVHDPLNDARQSARLLTETLQRT